MFIGFDACSATCPPTHLKFGDSWDPATPGIPIIWGLQWNAGRYILDSGASRVFRPPEPLDTHIQWKDGRVQAAGKETILDTRENDIDFDDVISYYLTSNVSVLS